MEIKFAKCVSFVDPLNSVPPANPVPPVADNQIVGARLNLFWQKWQEMGVAPRVILILKEGYILPFNQRPKLTRSPVIVSGYADVLRNQFLSETLHALTQKNAIEKVQNPRSLAFYNRLFLVPKPNKKMEANSRSECPKQIFESGHFQDGNSRFHQDFFTSRRMGDVHRLQGRILPYPHSSPIKKISQISHRRGILPIQSSTLRTDHTAPMEFTVVVKEVKLKPRESGYTSIWTTGWSEPTLIIYEPEIWQIPSKHQNLEIINFWERSL